MIRGALSSAMLVKAVLEQNVCHIQLCMSNLCQADIVQFRDFAGIATYVAATET